MMLGRQTLTIRFTLFLAGVIIIMLSGSYLVTTNVVETGLEDLLRQRLEFATQAVLHYNRLHVLTRQNKVDGLMSSPRFLAAVDTGDSTTIADGIPQFLRQTESDFLILTDVQGQALSGRGHEKFEGAFVEFMSSGKFKDTVMVHASGAMLYEVFLIDVATPDGYVIGRLAVGYLMSAQLLNDLNRLAGFDAVLTYHGEIFGTAGSPRIADFVHASRWHQFRDSERGSILTSEVNNSEYIYSRIAMSPLPTDVMLVTSVEEHIAPILNSQIRQLLIPASVAGLIGIFVIYQYIRRRVGHQMRHLVTATERIARNEMQFEIKPLSGDEFGYLAEQLDLMRLELLRNREELDAAHAEQVKAERMVTIGQLATGIIHDFKNPIGVIRGTAELIPEKIDNKERVIKYCQTIRDQVDRVVALTHDILDYARGAKALELEDVELNRYLREIIAFHLPQTKPNGIDIRLLPAGIATARLDPSRLRRVLDNLIANATEAIGVRGEILISWDIRDRDLRLTIADNGPGIPDEVKDRIFEPFVTHGKTTGTGLGLAIGAKIIEDHGGSIKVYSDSSSGTTFEITLPEAVSIQERNKNQQIESVG